LSGRVERGSGSRTSQVIAQKNVPLAHEVVAGSRELVITPDWINLFLSGNME
jgi:hypothetical protein